MPSETAPAARSSVRRAYYEPARWYDLRDFSMLGDVEFFAKMAGQYGPRVLELAVGTGRIAIPLARSGFEVWGIDRDEAMIQRATAKWQAARKSAKGALRLVHADITDYRLRRRFDMAFVAFNTFLTLSTLEQREQALRCARRHLTPGGRLLIDIFQPVYSHLAVDTPEHLDFAIADPETGGIVERYSWDHRDMSAQQIQVSFEYRWRGPDGAQQRETSSFPMCVIFPVEMRLLLERTGFTVESVYGDHDASPFRKHSPRMIFVARKAPTS